MNRIKIVHALKNGPVGEQIEIRGWVRTRRESKQGFAFVEVNDGSCMANLQVIVEKSVPGYDDFIKHLTTGTSIRVEGELKASPAKGQAVEVHASSLSIYGTAD